MQKTRMDKTNKLFLNALKQEVFQCAAVSFSKHNRNGYERFEKYYGLSLLKNHFFDLASLTKPLATVPLLLSLFNKRLLEPETELGTLFKKIPKNKSKISIKQLMSHCAGFVAHREFYKDLLNIPEKNRKRVLLQKILDEELVYETGKNHCYSDLGFMLLGLIIEKIEGKKIGELANSYIYRPLNLQNELYFPGLVKKKSDTYVSTENCLWDKTMLNGLVHDDNCRASGGNMGHAGLFGTLKGVMTFCEHLLDQWQGRGQHPSYSNELLQKSLKRVGNSTWTMGFDMVSEKGSSSGSYFSKRTVGHLGFTGTSFWIDPEKDCITVLLTNRVYYGRENWKIREFRPALHDILMKEKI